MMIGACFCCCNLLSECVCGCVCVCVWRGGRGWEMMDCELDVGTQQCEILLRFSDVANDATRESVKKNNQLPTQHSLHRLPIIHHPRVSLSSANQDGVSKNPRQLSGGYTGGFSEACQRVHSTDLRRRRTSRQRSAGSWPCVGVCGWVWVWVCVCVCVCMRVGVLFPLCVSLCSSAPLLLLCFTTCCSSCF
jgi:hypothetical protein